MTSKSLKDKKHNRAKELLLQLVKECCGVESDGIISINVDSRMDRTCVNLGFAVTNKT